MTRNAITLKEGQWTEEDLRMLCRNGVEVKFEPPGWTDWVAFWLGYTVAWIATVGHVHSLLAWIAAWLFASATAIVTERVVWHRLYDRRKVRRLIRGRL